MLRPVAIALVVAALVAGCGSDDSGDSGDSSAASTGAATTAASDPSTTAAAPDTVTPGTVVVAGDLTWRRCQGQPGFECTTLDVPLDHDEPGGTQVPLALIRRPASDPSARIGSLVLNPGGPGGSGIDFLPSFAFAVDSAVTDRFDLVSFDPRGVGESGGLVCFSDEDKDTYAALDAVPEPDEVAAVESMNEQFASTCADRYGDALSHYGTVDAARDLDLIREAVGDDKLTYLGFSYGTRLGSVYAELFPDKVRALALDGAVDPDPAAADFLANQTRGFQEAFDAFVADCDADSSCPAGPDTAALVDELFARVEDDPIPADSDDRELTEGWLTSGLLNALYAKELWSPLAVGLRQAQQGDSSLMLQIADVLSGRRPDGTWDNLWEANAAVNCIDDPQRESLQQVEQLATDLAAVSPRFGPVIGWGTLQCTNWPVPPDPIPVAVAAGSAPIVVIGTTRDPATPYVWAERMASTLDNAALITRDGDGHTAYAESPCVAQMVDDYLINLTVPPPKAFCAG